MITEFGQCFGLTEETRISSSGFMTLHRAKRNSYIGKNFFEDKNYEIILECMDGGYESSIAITKCMQQYVKFRKNEADQLIKYSRMSTSRLRTLSSLSSYGTTIEVQLNTFNAFETQANIIIKTCPGIETVINDYTTKVNEMYPKIRFRSVRKHYRTEQIKGSFKRARAPLNEAIEYLEKLRKTEKKLRDSIETGTVGSENGGNYPTNDDTQNKLQEFKRQINEAEALRDERTENYIKEATKIFQECHKLEKERLDQMKEALDKFIHAIHPIHYSAPIGQNFDMILADIKTKQNTLQDVNTFTQSYGIDTATFTVVSTTIEDTAIQNGTIATNDEER